MGRCNNRRTREAAAAMQNTPSRARFSKGPPKKQQSKKRAVNETTKQAVVHKIVQRFEAPIIRTTTTTITSNSSVVAGNTTLRKLDDKLIQSLDEIKLSEESVTLIEQQLRDLKVIKSNWNLLENVDEDESQQDMEEEMEYITEDLQKSSIQQSAGYAEYEDDYDSMDENAADHAYGNTGLQTDETGWDGQEQQRQQLSASIIDEAMRTDPVFLNLTQSLSFTETQAAQACRVLANWNGAHAASSSSDTSHRHQLSLALDWLALHLTEAELKVGFQNQRRPEMEIQAVRTKAIPHPSISVATKLTEDTEFLLTTKLERQAVSFIQLGFPYEDVIEVLKRSASEQTQRLTEALDDTIAIRSLLAMLEREVLTSNDLSNCTSGSEEVMDDEMSVEERDLEQLALEGIYETGFAKKESEKPGNERYQISLSNMGTTGDVHVFVRPGYPTYQLPLILYHDAECVSPLLRRINTELILEVQKHAGIPCVYEVVSFLCDNLAGIRESFAKETRARKFEERQLEMRRLAGHDVELWGDDSGVSGVPTSRRQKARIKAAERAYVDSAVVAESEQDRFRREEERISNMKHSDASIRSIRAEKVIREREQQRTREEIERISRDIMSASLNRGESVEMARAAAHAAENQYRKEHGMPYETETVIDDYASETVETTERSEVNENKDLVQPATATTQAFMDRLRSMYTAAKESTTFRLSDVTQPEKGETSQSRELALPRPVAYPAGDLTSIMEDVAIIQKEQPWLISEEARVPIASFPCSPQSSELESDWNNTRDAISKELLRELDKLYASAEGKRQCAFRNILTQRQSLPAYQSRDSIISTINNNQVTVVAGDTGCGKTTQVPQLILDDMIRRGIGANANLIVTQPRRISAIGVADRIASERNERTGQTCGYSIKLEKKISKKTRLLLCTTGILLRRLQLDPDLASVSHVFVDEVHERDLNTDFLLIILKNLLRRRKSLKLVLMSATLNSDKFSQFFDDCAVISIPGRTHPVQEFRLEDVLQLTGHEINEESDVAVKSGHNRPLPRWSKSLLKKRYYPKYNSHVIHSLSVVDEAIINYELIAVLLEFIAQNTDDGAILVFLPGMGEITKAMEELYKKELFQDASHFVIIPLHSSMSAAEQSTVFTVPPIGTRKIVLSTNLSETSITIEDVVYVVDTGRVKENQRDEIKETPALVETWISHAAAKQRRGRAGRVRPGVCYHLFSSHTHDEVMQSYQLPEMLRVGLEDIALQIMILDLGEPHEFLYKALDPPSLRAVSNALRQLQSLGAVECRWSQSTMDSHEPDTDCGCLSVTTELTALGFHLASLPVEPRVGKMLLYGSMFGCADPALTIAASLTTSRSLFMSSFSNRDAADAARRELATENSDLLTVLSVFDYWDSLSDRAANKYIREHFLSRDTLYQIKQLKQQYSKFLVDSGFLPEGYASKKGPTTDRFSSVNANVGNVGLLKAVLCAGLYPNVMVAPRTLVNSVSTQSAGEMAFRSHKKGDIYLHPSTILHTAKKIDGLYACFYDIIKTSKLYVRDCTLVSPVALVLFGGAIEIYHKQNVITVDEWLRFRMPVQHATLLKHLRVQMEKVLLQKIVAPDEDVVDSATGKALINSVSLLLGQEKLPTPLNDGSEIVRPWYGSENSGDYGARGRGRGGGRGRGRSGRGNQRR